MERILSDKDLLNNAVSVKGFSGPEICHVTPLLTWLQSQTSLKDFSEATKLLCLLFQLPVCIQAYPRYNLKWIQLKIPTGWRRASSNLGPDLGNFIDVYTSRYVISQNSVLSTGQKQGRI